MKRNVALGLFLAGALALTGVAPARAGILINEAVPFEQTVNVPCANGGLGEDVVLSGFLHVLVTATQDAAGNVHSTTHFQPMGIAGTGATTGDVYRATGITRDEANGLDMPFETTFVNNFRLVGPGKGNNALVHETAHVTINANGDVSANLDFFTEECK
jgi:hypothetical protein